MNKTEYSQLPPYTKGSKAQLQMTHLRRLSKLFIAAVKNYSDEISNEHLEFVIRRTREQANKGFNARHPS